MYVAHNISIPNHTALGLSWSHSVNVRFVIQTCRKFDCLVVWWPDLFMNSMVSWLVR